MSRNKISILSIDWDYFIDATYKERRSYFPDGTTDELHPDIQSVVWASRYAEEPEIEHLGVTDHFDQICKFLSNMKRPTEMMLCDSHLHAHDFILRNVKRDEEIAVVNIDFHHDLYENWMDSNRPYASDWALKLKKQLPHMSLKWVKHVDSEMPKKHIATIPFEKAMERNYDMVFLCRSGAWSPPHLDEKFIEMADVLLSRGPVLAEGGITKAREYISLKETFAEQRRDFLRERKEA